MPRVAVVLPPREFFSADRAGAIALQVAAMARVSGEFAPTVVGPQVAEPFPGVEFMPAPRLPLPVPLATRYAAGVARLLARLRPALVEVHNRPDLARALARRGHPTVLFLHNDPQPMRGFRRQFQRDRVAGRLARVIAVSEWVRQRTGLAGCLVLPNHIDLRGLPTWPSGREQTVLFAGRIVADKGADAFVAAWAQARACLPDWRAEMVGADGFGAQARDTPFLRALRPRAAAAGVAMTGWLPHAGVLAAMARAAIVVVPSRWPEPFGLTALEAMACGAALAFSPRGGLPEVVGEAGRAIDPDDPQAMAAALVALARDPGRRGALGRAGLARARLFDVTAARARLDALRAEIVATWPSGGAPPISAHQSGGGAFHGCDDDHGFGAGDGADRLSGRRQDHAAEPHPVRGTR